MSNYTNNIAFENVMNGTAFFYDTDDEIFRTGNYHSYFENKPNRRLLYRFNKDMINLKELFKLEKDPYLATSQSDLDEINYFYINGLMNLTIQPLTYNTKRGITFNSRIISPDLIQEEYLVVEFHFINNGIHTLERAINSALGVGGKNLKQWSCLVANLQIDNLKSKQEILELHMQLAIANGQNEEFKKFEQMHKNIEDKFKTPYYMELLELQKKYKSIEDLINKLLQQIPIRIPRNINSIIKYAHYYCDLQYNTHFGHAKYLHDHFHTDIGLEHYDPMSSYMR